jgi:hypothetical protein
LETALENAGVVLKLSGVSHIYANTFDFSTLPDFAMKLITPKFLSLLLFAVFAVALTGMARSGRHRQGEERPIRREIKAYFQRNVLPVLQQQRQKLEPQLTAADRTQLAAYRVQLREVKARGKGLRQSLRPAGQPYSIRPTLTATQQQQVYQLRSEARGVMLNVAQIAQKYDTAIEQLNQEVQPQKTQWTADIRTIVAKNATPEHQQTRASLQERKHERGLRQLFKPAVFLLMDPNAPAGSPAERGPGTTAFYPNPTAATSQLEYDVKKAGPVTIDLLDKDGNKLRTLAAAASEEKGQHTQHLDLHDLPAGTYYYKITTKRGTKTERFVKE